MFPELGVGTNLYQMMINLNGYIPVVLTYKPIIIIIIIEGLSLLQSIPPTTADKQTNSTVINSAI